MILSELLQNYFADEQFQIRNEKPFQYLGLIAQDAGNNKCTFIDRKEFIEKIDSSTSMVITNEDIAKTIDTSKYGICIAENPRLIYFKLHNRLCHNPEYTRPIEKNRIGRNCKIHSTAIIADNNVVIGDNVIIEEFVVIRENTIIGDNTIIRTGVKIGCPDFEFKRDKEGIFGVTHVGGVKLGSNIEVLSNTGINKAIYPWDDTEIGDFTKIDMLCNISHGAKIGKNVMIVALAGVGGRTVIGDNSWIGYGAILRNGIAIGESARVNMGAIVTKDVDPGESVTGNFAIDHELFMEELKTRIGGK